MSEDLETQIDVRPAGTVVRLKGHAAVNSGKMLELTLTRLCATRPNLVVMDLSELQMVASLVIGQLVSLKKSLSRHGGKLRLAAVPPLVMTSLTHTRMDSVFECFPTVDEALKV